ncbi:hypothetical protein b3_0188 [Synechococcus phage B3]|nr:hypothetical protein b3_0188 [Synechococcus phage B3]QGT54802.1 hypothetical protein b23_0187 [Synechococcus phage B23]
MTKQYYYTDKGSYSSSWHDEGAGPLPTIHPGSKVGGFSLFWRDNDLSNTDKTEPKGLYRKYNVLRKHDANPVQYPCFVLRVDGQDKAAIKALITYANNCDEPLATELRAYVTSILALTNT